MRIAHVTDCYLPRIGGIEQQVFALTERQAARGHEVHVFTAVPGPTSHSAPGVSVHRPPGRGNRIRYDWSLRGVSEIAQGGFDIVHAHVSTVSPLALRAAVSTARMGRPAAVTVHSLWTNLAPLYRPVYALYDICALPLAWSAVSELAAETVRPIVGAHHDVTILPNGVAAAEWATRSPAREPDKVVYATVGRLAARKRPRHLVRMLRAARAEVPAHIDMQAVLIGDGPQRPLLEGLLRRYGMTEWVRLVGMRSHQEVRELLADTDVYVAPATLESFGIAALEARCAGLPVIARRRSGIAGFIEHGVDGLLAVDDDDMTAQIVRLAVDRDLREGMRHHNHEHAPPLRWDDALEECDQLYLRATSLARGVPANVPR